MGDKDIEEFWVIREILESYIPRIWDGRYCILELREADYNWRQMEWMGWYFEYKARNTLIENIGGSVGRTYGSTTIDYRNNHSWDFKVHPINSSGHPWAIMNDCDAVNTCIENEGGMGFIIALGRAQYNDTNNSFKLWHDELKGGISEYEKDRIRRRAPSRRRKTQFEIVDYLMIYLNSTEELEKAIDERWLGYAQRGWRNADGSPRKEKYKIQVELLPDWSTV